MKRKTSSLLAAIMMLALQTVRGASPAMLLEKGVFAEETKGDIDAAMKIYKRIIDDADANRKHIVRAHYRLGTCLLKKKQYSQAGAAFRRVIAEFPKEVKLVARAQKQLRQARSRITGAELAKIVAQAVTTISTCAETDPRVRPALDSLVGLNEPEVVKELTKHFDSEKNTVRRSAIYILWKGTFSEIAAAEAGLTKLCKHKESLTRGMAALPLGSRKINSSFQTLCDMALKDESSYARRCAAYALGMMGNPAAKSVLDKALKDKSEFVRSNAEAALTMLTSQARLPEEVIGYIVDIHMADYKESQAKGQHVNSHIYGVDDQFNLHFGGLMAVKNKTDKVIKDEISVSSFSYADFEVMNETGALQKIRFVNRKTSTGGRYRLMWTPDKPLQPGQVRLLGWKKKATTELPKTIGGFQLTMKNHFGAPVLESFFMVAPPNVAIAKQSSDYVSRKRIGPFDVYHWRRQVPPGTTNRVEVVLKKTETIGQAAVLGYVDDSAESRRSIGGSGHAVVFRRAGTVQAVRIFASRYGYPKAPNENFSVYLLDDKHKILSETKFAYATIERGDMKWYTLDTKPTAVGETFYVALSFNPHRTKGIYLGLDSSVTESHSYTGLPGRGFTQVAENSDWMVRVDLAPSVADDTPRILQTTPQTFADDVDPALAKMTVMFDREMKDRCWSWTQIDPKLFPKRVGKISYDAKRLICTMPVKLAPGKVYWVGINRQPFMNFTSKTGTPSRPYVILFATKSAGGKPTAIPADMLARAKAINSASQTPDQRASAQLANRAWYLWNQRKFEESEKLFRQAVQKDPKNSNAWNGLGWALQNQGKSEAPKAFTKCLALDSKNSGALNGMGWIAKLEGREDDAIVWWQKAVMANPQTIASLRGLTMTFMARGQYHQAAVCYAAWVKVDPSNKKIKAELDDALAKAKAALAETRKALVATEKWLALLDEGKYAETWDQSAGVFRKNSAKKQWIATLKGLLGSLGKMKSRVKQDADYRTSLPGSPAGEYVVFIFKTTFANKKDAIETVTPMKDKDGKWRVSGYYIK